MITQKFMNLTVFEQRDFIGSLCHAATNDEICFEMAARVLNYAKAKGVLDGVIINPPPMIEEDNLSNV